MHTDELASTCLMSAATSDPSLVAFASLQVIGVGMIEPQTILAKMPYMRVDCAAEDSLLKPPNDYPTNLAETSSRWLSASRE